MSCSIVKWRIKSISKLKIFSFFHFKNIPTFLDWFYRCRLEDIIVQSLKYILHTDMYA